MALIGVWWHAGLELTAQDHSTDTVGRLSGSLPASRMNDCLCQHGQAAWERPGIQLSRNRRAVCIQGDISHHRAADSTSRGPGLTMQSHSMTRCGWAFTKAVSEEITAAEGDEEVTEGSQCCRRLSYPDLCLPADQMRCTAEK